MSGQAYCRALNGYKQACTDSDSSVYRNLEVMVNLSDLFGVHLKYEKAKPGGWTAFRARQFHLLFDWTCLSPLPYMPAYLCSSQRWPTFYTSKWLANSARQANDQLDVCLGVLPDGSLESVSSSIDAQKDQLSVMAISIFTFGLWLIIHVL